MRLLLLCLFVWSATTCLAVTADEPGFLLAPDLAAGDSWVALVKLRVGGDLSIRDAETPEKLPLSVRGELCYEERLLAWSASGTARSLRCYQNATADIQVGDGGERRALSASAQRVIAEVHDNRSALNGTERPLSRQQYDLLNTVGNTLALQRLLPDRAVAEGETWDHPITAIGPLLGLDHVAACEVASVVAGADHNGVQLRLAGTVHGTMDGAPTEMELRGAYLFDLGEKRIAKFNLAIKELRTASEIVPGLDIVAKISITLQDISDTPTITDDQARLAANQSLPVGRDLLFDAGTKGYRFTHDKAWYVTGEQSELLSLRYMKDGDLVAHCNLTALPARSQGRATSLDQFERDVRDSLGESLETVVASTHWATAQGYGCLGVIAMGEVQGVPIEWRYYLIAADGLPRVSLAVTVEQSMLQQFNDSDRQLVESLELIPPESEQTAAKSKTSILR
ncbi:MAG: hypothetical protein MK171_00725 [Pirellulales bacterium]|nr:hypothetical protein [Pirellulales bacterium]